MSFSATIDESDTKALWCRCINSLNNFQNEQIKFVISQNKLTISSLNSSHTSYGEIQFDKPFFSNYQFDPTGIDIQDEGLCQNDEQETAYCFLVRSRLLFMLFNKKNDDEYEYFKISFNTSSLKDYRLNIQIKTKSMIRKNYNPFFIPTKNDYLKISKLYKDQLMNFLTGDAQSIEQDDEEVDPEMNYIMINNNIIKNFIDNTSGNTEDFKIEVNDKLFSMTGFTKGIFIKEKEILKQPMDVNISLKSEELLDLKLYPNLNDANGLNNKKIIYKMKDFKNLLNLGNHNEYIEIWFKKEGDPILFELKKSNVLIQFVQITDSGDNQYRQRKILPKEQQPKQKQRKQRSESVSEVVQPLFVHDEDEEDYEPIRPKPIYETFNSDINHNDNANDKNNNETNDDKNTNKDYYDTPDQDEDEPYVTWNENDTNLRSISSKKQVIKEMRDQYLQNMKNDNKKRRVDPDTEKETLNDDELGPTQNITTVHGLFD